MRTFFLKLFLFLAIGTLSLGAHSFLYAQTEGELRVKISETENKIKEIEQEIIQYKNDLEKITTLKKSLKTLIAELDTTRKKLDAEIRVTATKVDSTDLKIRELSNNISFKEDEIATHEAALNEAIRAVYERDERSLTEIALSKESFSGLWDDLEAITQFSDTVRLNTEILKELKIELEEKQGVRQKEKNKLLVLKEELSDRKKIAEDTKKKNAALLAQTNNKESNYNKLLKEKIALKDAFEKELSDYESTLKFILDPSSIPTRGSKIFSPPLDSVYITQKFGKTSASGRLYVSGTHNGVDFRASIGTQVKAMAKGTVAGAGNTDLTCPGASFGKWVLIRYENGLAATFGHLSQIKVAQGDTVGADTIIGYSGNTGYSTGPHLHMSVYANDGVEVKTLPSKSCSGRMYTMPMAAMNAYLDLLDYM
jgi:murein DD-endopeptidase MepM/ murein hydrolase activator NlpD